MPALHIQILGDFRITYDDVPVMGVSTPRLQSLLAYLVLRREAPQLRRQVAFLLWPESTEAQARTNLRRELHYLRRALPDAHRFLHADAKIVQWQPDAPFTLDVADFEATLARAELAAQAGNQPAVQMALAEAVDLYRGDLLPDCYDDWILSERERLAHRFIQSLERLIPLLESQRDYPTAIRYAQRLLRYDPLHEATYRRLMRLHALNGDRARGLRVYHTCATVLQRELGVAPSPATQEAYARLLDVEAPPVPPVASVTGWRLVGRQGEWESLLWAWRTAAEGQAHFVLVSGEAGIGKTRLIEELLEWAIKQGIATAQTRSYAAEGRLAYGPVVEWLRSEALAEGWRGLEEVWKRELARLMPEVMEEGVAEGEEWRGEWQRRRLFEGLARAILGTGQPLLLVVEDLQWCDRETLEWLHFLLRFDPQARLLLVGTVRSEEMDVGDTLTGLVLGLREVDQVSEIALRPLDESETFLLAAQAAGQKLDVRLKDRLFLETEGNPLFVVELCRGMREPGGAAGPLVAEWGLRDRPAPLSPRVQAVIQGRMMGLTKGARELAEIAAVIGRKFRFEVLAEVNGRKEEGLVQALDELWQRGIVREQGVDGYDFSHDKIREVVYEGISRARRQLLHRRVAEALVAVHAGRLDEVSEQVALHYEEGVQPGEAMEYYERAARVMQRVYANEEALGLYTRAIALSEKTSSLPEGTERWRLYERRGLIWQALSRYDEAIEDFEKMRQMAREAGNFHKEGESLCHLAYAHWLMVAEEQVPFVEQYAREAAQLFEQAGDQRVLARSLTMLGSVDQVRGDLPGARQKLEEALQISRQAESNDALVQTLSFLCLQASLEGDFPSVIRFAQEGVAVAREIHDDFNALRIQAFLCQGLWSVGRCAEALTMAHEGLTKARERGNTFIVGRLLNTLGWIHNELGDIPGAVIYNQQSVEIGKASGISHVEISALVNLGYDYLALGRHDHALTFFEPTLERIQREGFGAHKWRWKMKVLLGLAAQALATGAYEPALRYGEAGLQEAEATCSQKYIVKGRALRGRLLVHLGNLEAAGTELQQAYRLAEKLNSPSLVYPLAHELGRWYEMTGHARQAAELYATAKTTLERMATALEDETLELTFLQSPFAQTIYENWKRTL